MKTYLKPTKYKTYKYIRRVPKELIEYTTTSTFRSSLGSNQLEATQMALNYNNAVEEALQLHELHMPKAMIIGKLEELLPKIAEGTTASGKPTVGLFESLSKEYLASQVDNISEDETRDKRYFYEVVSPHIFEYLGLSSNPNLNVVKYNNLLDFRNTITKLPKRNIHKYRVMKFSKILNNLQDVREDELLSSRTVNKYIKWLRALFNFAVMLNYIQVNFANSLPLKKTLDDKLQRLPLTELEIIHLEEVMPQKMKYLFMVLAYTGMRLSELYKCEVVTIDDVKCFSLMDRSIKLKTKSSYRLIPVHRELLEELSTFEVYRSNLSSEHLAKTTSATIKSLGFESKEKKSLYSLRHSFATRLIQAGADTAIVSELLGHAHSTMTLSRYSTGFSVKQLQEVVELL